MQNKYNVNNNFEVGIDEAGRGPLCGPVVAGAVIWDEKLNNFDEIKYIIDSKKLTPKRRKIAYDFLIKNLKYYGIGVVDNNTIDNINILEATKLAMKRAIDDLNNKLGKNKIDQLIIDGVRWDNCFNYNTVSIVKGDDKYYSISSASIIAKEHHDNLIKYEVENNPDLNKYDILSNKGYGTKKHLIALETFGPSYYHRKSFKRCK